MQKNSLEFHQNLLRYLGHLLFFFLLLVAIAVLTLGHVPPGGGQDLLQNLPQGPRHGAVELQGDFNLAILAGELPVIFQGWVESGVEEGLVLGHDAGILVFVGLDIVVIRILISRSRGLLLGQRFGKDGGVGVHPAEVAVHVLEHLGVRLPLLGGHDDQRHRLAGFGLLGLLLISASSTGTRRVLELVGVAAAKVLEEAGQAEAGSGPAVVGEVADPLEEVLPNSWIGVDALRQKRRSPFLVFVHHAYPNAKKTNARVQEEFGSLRNK